MGIDRHDEFSGIWIEQTIPIGGINHDIFAINCYNFLLFRLFFYILFYFEFNHDAANCKRSFETSCLYPCVIDIDTGFLTGNKSVNVDNFVVFLERLIIGISIVEDANFINFLDKDGVVVVVVDGIVVVIDMVEGVVMIEGVVVVVVDGVVVIEEGMDMVIGC